jgi:hypothetical protein
MSSDRDATDRLEELIALAEAVGLTVRRQAMGGDGGGIIRLRQRWILLVDTDRDVSEELLHLGPQVGRWPGCDEQYVTPALREYLGGES